MTAKTDGCVTVLISRHLDAISRRISPDEMAKELTEAFRSFKSGDLDLLTDFFVQNAVALIKDAAETLIAEYYQKEFLAFLKEANDALWTQEMIDEEMFRSFERVDVLSRAIILAAQALRISDRVGMSLGPYGDIILTDVQADKRAKKPQHLARHIEEIAKRISIEEVAQKIVLVVGSLGGPDHENIAQYIIDEGEAIAEDAVHAVMRGRFKQQLLAFYRDADSVCLDLKTTEHEFCTVITTYRLISRALNRAKQILNIEDHIREIERARPYQHLLEQRTTRPQYLN